MMLLSFAAFRVSAGWTFRSRLIFISGCASMHAMVYIHDKQNHHVWSVYMNESFHFITGGGESMLTNIQRSVIIYLLGVVAFTVGAGASAAGPVRAVAVISGCNDDHVEGSAKFIERQSKEGVKIVDVSINVRGLNPGMHAVHIHETGNCTPCSEAKGHFDPGPHGFTSPDGNHPFHLGDLVNINVNESGAGALHTVTTRVTLSPGPLSLFDADGSAIIIHTNPDTYCPEGAVTGCAGGARAACGIITLQ